MQESTNKQGGYIAALIGAICGAAFSFGFSLFLSGAVLTQFGLINNYNATVVTTIFVILATSCGEVLGCYFGLRAFKYRLATRTAVWLAVLFIPGWLLLIVTSFIGLLIVAPILIVIVLPLLARALTNNPNYFVTIQRMLDVIAKRPPNF